MTRLQNIYFEAIVRRVRKFPASLVAITALGLLARLAYLVAYPINWKMSATFNVFELGLVGYISDFAGYKPSRMPFFDVFSAASYAVFGPLLGIEALVVFNLLLAVAAIPAFYLAIEKLYCRQVAVPASLLFALYPKYVLMTSTGLPEAAAISSLAFALYSFAHAQETGRLRAYFLTGFFTMISFIMFVPAVAVGLLLAIFIYFSGALERFRHEQKISTILPTSQLAVFGSAPGIVGFAYLIFGPISETMADVSQDSMSLFTNPEAYTLVEKIFWYLAYTFFDFWWHTRGFDRERGIRPLLESLAGFFGQLFPVYLIGWAAITLVLTTTMLVGFLLLLRRQSRLDLLIICWIAVYAAAYMYKTSGWIGGFQTRHVSPVFPALCLVFGVGVWWLSTVFISRDLPVLEWQDFNSYWHWLGPSTVLTVLLMFGLFILLVNGGVQGVIEQEKTQEDIIEPATEVSAIVEDDETVAVVWARNHHNIVLYSENQVRPTLLVDSEQRRNELETRHRNNINIQTVKDPLLRDTEATYLYIHTEPEYIERFPYTVTLNQSRVNQLREKHTIVYKKHVSDGPFRTSSAKIYLLRIESDVSNNHGGQCGNS